MPIDQVTELLVRWRGTGGVMARARVLREGIHVLGDLDADERRLLARSLAEQGAPDLANRLEQRTGGDLSADQLWSVADGLLSMDDQQVDRLATSLREPAERQRLVREALIPGRPPFDPRQGPVPDGPSRAEESPPPGAIAAPTDLASGEPQHRGEGLGDQLLGDQELGTVALGTAALGTAGIVDVGLHGTETDAATTATRRSHGDGQDDGQDVGVAQQVGRVETGTTGRSGSTAASSRVEQDPADAPGLHTDLSGPVVLPPASEPVSPDGVGSTTDLDDEQAWYEQLRAANTATARFRLLDPDLLAGLDSTKALALLDTLPAGWQRRRGAERLVDAGAFPTDRLAETFTRFARATDAVFVAGALLAADQVRAERFDGILPTRAVHRLIARSER